MKLAGLVAAAALALGGCVFQDVREQLEKIGTHCTVEGRASAANGPDRSIVVVLFRRGGAAGATSWTIADHFVMERDGRWSFIVPPGAYAVAAFEDANHDRVYQPAEPHVRAAFEQPMECAPGKRIDAPVLAIPERSAQPFPRELDVVALQARDAETQMGVTLGQKTVVGVVATLADARFSEAKGEDSMWRPLDFVVEGLPGIYFLEPYDPNKVPVLFVHGINGSPVVFAPLIEKLDRRRFQPWFYYYPSGARLARVGQHLDQTFAKLQELYRFPRFAVVAHSMGGLVSRDFVLRHAVSARAERLPVYITIATPWGGHAGAAAGVKMAPAVVGSWMDMAPASDFLRDLLARPLPEPTRHHLIFAFDKGSGRGESSDGVITLASQLEPRAAAPGDENLRIRRHPPGRARRRGTGRAGELVARPGGTLKGEKR
jgi:pimeloyl-ACP methyl ester carboxylesterase